MTYFLLGALFAIGAIVFLSSCKRCIETFQDCKMRPWWGYEPGYGPGWGRKGCCDVPVPPNMKNETVD